MKNLKKALAIILTAIIMLSITAVFAGAVNEERVNRVGYSSINDADVQDDFKISKVFKIGAGETLYKEDLLKAVDIKADEYMVGSLYQNADVYNEDGDLIGFNGEQGNCIDLILVDAYKSAYDEEFDCYYLDYIGTRYFLIVVNVDGEDMGEVTSMSIDDFTFNYKSEYIWLYANTETKNNDGAYWLEYYVMDNYDEDPFVASDGSVSTYFTGTSHVTCYVIDAEGNVFSDNCTVTVRLTFLQWIIKYLCFGWLWGF